MNLWASTTFMCLWCKKYCVDDFGGTCSICEKSLPFLQTIKAQKEKIDKLEESLNDLKKNMSDFINACELSPDGEYANETLERLHKSLKK